LTGGPALKHFDRVTLTDTLIYVEGRIEIVTSAKFAALNVAGNRVSTPVAIVLEFRDGLLLGEMVYMDGAATKVESYTLGHAVAHWAISRRPTSLR